MSRLGIFYSLGYLCLTVCNPLMANQPLWRDFLKENVPFTNTQAERLDNIAGSINEKDHKRFFQWQSNYHQKLQNI